MANLDLQFAIYLKKEIEDKNNQFDNLQAILNQQQQLLLYEQHNQFSLPKLSLFDIMSLWKI